MLKTLRQPLNIIYESNWYSNARILQNAELTQEKTEKEGKNKQQCNG
jgi:hypothetical protein